MKTLYFIGNGFDIAHDIKSRYKDFRDFMNASKEYDDLVASPPDDMLYASRLVSVLYASHSVSQYLIAVPWEALNSRIFPIMAFVVSPASPRSARKSRSLPAISSIFSRSE